MSIFIYIVASIFIVLVLFMIVNKYKNYNIIKIPILILLGFILGMYSAAIELKYFFWDILKIEKYYEYNIIVDGTSISTFIITFFLIIRMGWAER